MTGAAFDVVNYQRLCLACLCLWNRVNIKYLDSLASDLELLPHNVLFLKVLSGTVLLCS
jgi:hypothetical protein